MIKLIAASDLLKRVDPPFDPMVRTDENGVSVFWGGYEYWIEWSRIDTHKKIVKWLIQLLPKEWEHTTPERIEAFINIVACHHNLDIHGSL